MTDGGEHVGENSVPSQSRPTRKVPKPLPHHFSYHTPESRNKQPSPQSTLSFSGSIHTRVAADTETLKSWAGRIRFVRTGTGEVQIVMVDRPARAYLPKHEIFSNFFKLLCSAITFTSRVMSSLCIASHFSSQNQCIIQILVHVSPKVH